MIGNKPSVYNAQSVYNQGVGGGYYEIEGSTIVIPPYLQLVEYIDTTNTTNFTAMGPFNLECKNTYDIKFILSYDPLNNPSAKPWQFVVALGESGSNISIGYEFKTDAKKGTMIYTGGVEPDVDLTAFNTDTDKVTFNFSAANQKIVVTDEHGHSAQGTRNSWFNYPKWGMWSVGGLSSQTNNLPFKGKFYGLICREGSTPLIALFPCRRTDNGKPCIVDVVSGSVGFNWTNNFDVSGVSFGDDIKIEDLEQYFN